MRLIPKGALRPCRGLGGLFAFLLFSTRLVQRGRSPPRQQVAENKVIFFSLLSLTSSNEETISTTLKAAEPVPSAPFSTVLGGPNTDPEEEK